jgi:ComF family protein
MPNPVNQTPAAGVYGHRAARWVAVALRSLFPARCLVCDEAGHLDQDLCLPCRLTLPWLPRAGPGDAAPVTPASAPPDAGTGTTSVVHACFLYLPPINRLLQRFKFHGDLAAGRLLAALMLERLHGADRPQALVPMPLHPGRLRQRGYDQALELARPLARALPLRLEPRLLWRHRATLAQSELSADARRRNVSGAFSARPSGLAHVALLDDVFTTGATVQAAALALRQAGVARVDAWVCARVP